MQWVNIDDNIIKLTWYLKHICILWNAVTSLGENMVI